MGRIFLVIAILTVYGNNLQAHIFKKKKKQEQKVETVDEYTKFLRRATTKKGVISLHQVEEKRRDGKSKRLYFEIPQELLGKEFLFGSKVSESSDVSIAMAGQMQFSPLLVYFTKEENNICIKQIITNNTVDTSQTISRSYFRNNIDPIIETFPIQLRNEKDTTFLIDVTDYLKSNKGKMGVHEKKPFLKPKGPKMFPLNYMTKITEFQAFKENINVKCRLNYVCDDNPFSVFVTRSFILLPEEPMTPRLSDRRLGYFSVFKYKYDENMDKGKSISYMKRWRIEPKKEDAEKYKAGELVEPEKPIVFYVDDALPLKWRKYIKQGIEDWQVAFEKIGFKNAIIAKDFPKDNPDFNPDDIRYSCFRYITTPIANAAGPSWVDPRSGEIIQGTVYMYHNILKLVHNWRFVQTAAVDPRVRKTVFDEEVMGESLRYVAAHEIGHTLGLKHNFASSAAIPVDSLRSPGFTKKYGTTYSIMDYARNNYVTQPEDKGVKLTPPNLGIYDIFAIKLGYKPVYNTPDLDEDFAVVGKWLEEKFDDSRYNFGSEKLSHVDPSSQSEDLGDNPIKAAQYGVKNAKIIMKNLIEWTTEEGDSYDETFEMYYELVGQYNSYISHVKSLIGGVYVSQPMVGDSKKAYVPVSKQKQKEALKFIFDEFRDQPNWILDENVAKKIGPLKNDLAVRQARLLKSLMSSYYLNRIETTKHVNNYSVREYLDDIYKEVWNPKSRSKGADKYQKNLEFGYLSCLLENLGYGETKKTTGNNYGLNNSDSSSNGGKDASFETKVVYFSHLKKIERLLQSKVKSGPYSQKSHYAYMLEFLRNKVKK